MLRDNKSKPTITAPSRAKQYATSHELGWSNKHFKKSVHFIESWNLQWDYAALTLRLRVISSIFAEHLLQKLV